MCVCAVVHAFHSCDCVDSASVRVSVLVSVNAWGCVYVNVIVCECERVCISVCASVNACLCIHVHENVREGVHIFAGVNIS